MRGGHLHNRLLVAPLEDAFCASGARTRTEVQVTGDIGDGFVDLMAECDDRVVAIEAELTARRVKRDLVKGVCCGADELWIVVPTRQVARAVRRTLKGSSHQHGCPEVFILTLGAALQRVKECFSLFSGSIPPGNQREDNHPTPSNAVPPTGGKQ